jgi:hypothetical protein
MRWPKSRYRHPRRAAPHAALRKLYASLLDAGAPDFSEQRNVPDPAENPIGYARADDCQPVHACYPVHARRFRSCSVVDQAKSA